jgi:hypothetical protein
MLGNVRSIARKFLHDFYHSPKLLFDIIRLDLNCIACTLFENHVRIRQNLMVKKVNIFKVLICHLLPLKSLREFSSSDFSKNI